jgi:hypothetical protein
MRTGPILEPPSGRNTCAVELSHQCGYAWAGGNHRAVTRSSSLDTSIALRRNRWTALAGLTALRPVNP